MRLYQCVVLFLPLLPMLSEGAEAFKVKLNTLDLDSDPSVVTNVTFDGLASATGVYTKAETDAKIVELAPPPGNYSQVSNKAMTAIQSLKPALDHADDVAFRAADDATNYTNKAISDIPPPDFTTSNHTLVGTIQATAPAPGNYSEVSNKAMTAVQSLQPAISHADTVAFKAADDATNYTNKAISEIPGADFSTNNQTLVDTIKATAPPPGDYSEVSNKAMTAIQTLTPATNYADHAILELARTNSVLSGGPYLTSHQSLKPATNYTDSAISDLARTNSVLSGGPYLTSHQSLQPATNYTDHAILELARTNSVLSGGPYLTEHQSLDPATNYANDVAFRAADDATNYTNKAISEIPPPDFTTGNSVLVSTIEATAPAPGNYSQVSNKAMTAIQSLQPAIDHANTVAFRAADDATNYTDKAISEIPEPDFTTGNSVLVSTIKAEAPPPGNYSQVSNKAMTAVQTLEPSTNYTDFAIVELARTNSVLSGGPYLTGHQSLEPATNYADAVAFRAADDATNYTDSSISSGNPAFVNAVTNCPVVIASSDASTIGEFGGYGTIGALLAALAAAITWLKTHKADKTELPYSIMTPTVTNGEAALVDRAINVIPQATAFSSVLLAAGTSGKARDMVLRINLAAETYIGFSGTDASGNVIQWSRGDPSGIFPAGESLIGISEISEGVFTASNQYALYGVEDILHALNNGNDVLPILLEVNYGMTWDDSSSSGDGE